LVNPANSTAERVIRDAQEAARAKGVQLLILKAGTAADLDSGFASLNQLHADALVVSADNFLISRRDQLVALASRHAVPAIYYLREYTAAGGLISYGASLAEANRQAGIYAGKILNGAKPADLPVQQPTKSSWSSTSRQPRRSASPCRPRSSREPTRSSNKRRLNDRLSDRVG
jgi:putative ABC transport system substrate-binding protein